MIRILLSIVALSTLLAGFLWCAAVIDRQDAARERGVNLIKKVDAMTTRLDEWERVDAARKAAATRPANP